jgi:IS1 family transposase
MTDLKLVEEQIVLLMNKIFMAIIITLTSIVFVLLFCTTTFAQESKQMTRLARLVIDYTQLESYRAFLKEEIETSLRVEPVCLRCMLWLKRTNRHILLFWKFMRMKKRTKNTFRLRIF